MASSYSLALRRTIFNPRLITSTPSWSTQVRHARVLTSALLPSRSRGRSLQTDSAAASERILEKYKEKLERKMKAEGVKTYDDLRERYKDKISAVKNDSTLPPLPAALLEDDPTAPPPGPPTPHQTVIPPPRTKSNAPPPGVKTLSSYVDIDKISALPPTEIEYIWRARHISDPQSLCAMVPADTFDRLMANARAHPMFILPLPRPGGAVEMHFLQWTFPHRDVVTVLFTSLAAYKLHGEFAVPHTTLTHHLELKQGKGVVPAQGQVVKDRGVSVKEGKWLVMALQKFYGASHDGAEGSRRIGLLETFSKGGQGFRVEDVIEEAEKL
ncbi:ATP11 protein-domain-containing protein [Kalaharituber pfeilii]|nr:ATP11 protein-domain-containing protein [Kalaharituber pfeilii]